MIGNYIHNKVRDEITYPLTIFTRFTGSLYHSGLQGVLLLSGINFKGGGGGGGGGGGQREGGIDPDAGISPCLELELELELEIVYLT